MTIDGPAPQLQHAGSLRGYVMAIRRAAISALSVLLIATVTSVLPAAPSEAALGGRFVTTWDTSIRHTVSLHMYGSVDVAIAWGDGTQSTVSGERAPDTTGPVKHTYAMDVDLAEVVVTGTFTRFGNYPVEYDDPDYTLPPWGLQTVEEWGPTGTTDLSGAFADAVYLTKVAEIPSGVTDMSHMFDRALAFNQPIADWDVSQVTDMAGMFRDSGFNQPIGNWDVFGVTDMAWMFAGTPFNHPLAGWDVSQVTDMSSMFNGDDRAHPFDQPIGKWDVSNVTDMSGMFQGAAFNRFIGNWDVSNVTSMAGMFSGINFGGGDEATNQFNRPIGDWDVSNVVSMGSMFNRSVFNQPIEEWDVSNVRGMGWMFLFSDFNQPIGRWDVSNVTDMDSMFGGSPFNRAIGGWDTSQVASMKGMFAGSRFNRPIGDWDVSGIRYDGDMDSMFEGARRFNRDLSGWCVPSIASEPRDFDFFTPAWVLPRPAWGTCPGNPDYRPVGTYTSVTGDGGALVARGTATADDHGVGTVAVGIRDQATGQWLQPDGTWGASFQKLWTTLTDPGATSTEWKIRRVLPPGGYGVSLFVKDTWGITNDPRPWREITVS